MKAICFDIEATDDDEILELSVYDVHGRNEIYHSYFKPVKSREWPNSQAIHHITPQMVASEPAFCSERAVVRRLVAEADVIVGFAVDNDIKYMKANGVEIPASVRVIDVRSWYGLIYGKEQGLGFNAVPRLAVCAHSLGIPFSEEEEAHSAGNDTRVTVELFHRMLADRCGGILTGALIDEMADWYEREREADVRCHAHGYISLVRKAGGYMLKNNHVCPEASDHVIEVESRFVAEHEIREKFARKLMPGRDLPVYRLDDKDLRFFSGYTNSYDATREAICKSIYNARKSRKTNLNFRL